MAIAKLTNPPPPSGASNIRWSKVGLMLFITYLVAYIDRTNMAIAAPSMIKELGLTSSEMGLLLSAFFGGYVFSLAFAGIVVTRFGAKRSMVLALIVFGLASASTGLTEDFAQLIAVRLLLGLGEGFVFPAITIFFVKWFPAWERGRISGLCLLAIPISALIMAPMGGWLIGSLGYKEMFVIQGIPPLIIAVLVAIMLKESPVHDASLNEKERDYISAHTEDTTADTHDKGAIRGVYFNLRIWLIGLVYLLWMTGLYGFNQWLPTLLSEASGSGIEAVGLLTAIPFVFAAIGMVFAASASDKARSNRTPYVVLPIFIAGIALLLQHFIGGGITAQIVFLIIAGVGIHAAFGPWWPWALNEVPANQTGYASSLVLTIGNFGGVIGPLLVGFLSGGKSIAQGGFYVLGYILIVAAILGCVIGYYNRFHKLSTKHPGLSSPQN